VQFRKNTRARRIIMRLSREGDAAVVTVPRGATRDQALAFAEKATPWLAKQLAKKTPRSSDAVLFNGERYRVVMTGERRGLIRFDLEEKTVHVPGDPAHGPRRLRDWLKAEAHRKLAEASRLRAEEMGLEVKRVTVRDQRSRWGSCSSASELSYSWRLIMAPPFVLDYVAVHEVAHIRHMNHGPGFWRLVLKHCPSAGEAKTWLRKHGDELHRMAV
jgi:predicted metal-dependent hydrolase